jgi:RHS repeat-associated protein
MRETAWDNGMQVLRCSSRFSPMLFDGTWPTGRAASGSGRMAGRGDRWAAIGLGIVGCLMTALGHAAAAQCGPSLLGAPCAADGVATQGDAGASSNLGIGNPVNLATGNKYQREVDLPALPGALGIELVRHYNARDVRAEALGRNWVWSYDTRLFRVGDMVQIVQADGSRVDFARHPGATTCLPADPALGVLHVQAGVRGETMAWQWRDGRVLQFDEDGFLVGISVATGQSLSIRRARDTGRHRGALLDVADPQGRRLVFDYGAALEDGWRPLLGIQTPAGRFTYAQDAERRLSTATTPAGDARDYLYEAGAAAWMTGIVERPRDGAPQRVRSWGYDARGRVVTATRGAPDAAAGALQISYAEGMTRVRDAAGGVTRLAHRQAGARTILTGIDGAGCEGCERADPSRRFDALGRLTQADGVGVDRDALGRVTTLRDGGATTRVAWLADSTLPTQVDAPSSVAGRSHARRIDWLQFNDPATGLWRAVPKRISEAGWRASAAGPQAISRGWSLAWKIERGVATLAGVRQEMPAGAMQAGDGVGRSKTLASVAVAGRQSASATVPLAAASVAKATAATPASGSVPGWPDLRWERDDFGLPTRAAGSGGKAVAGAEVRDHDAAGRLISRVFGDGTQWTYDYDAAGRLQRHVAQRAGETVEARLAWQDGLPVGITHPVESEQRSYGPDGRMTRREVTRPAGAQGSRVPVRYAETFGWDAQGHMQRHDLPEGGTVFYEWSDKGLAAIRYAPISGPEVRIFSQSRGAAGGMRQWFNGVMGRSQSGLGLQYQADGRVLLALSRRTDRRGRVLDEGLRRPAAETLTRGASRADVFAASRYGYDADGRLIVAARAGGAGGVPALWPRPTVDFYAWQPGGEAAAQASHGWTTRPARLREAGGLPRRVDGVDLRYGPSRRLVAVDRAGVAIARYQHNAFGERVIRQVGDAAPTHDFYLGQQLVAEQGDGPVGTIARRYLYAGLELVAILDYAGGRALQDPSLSKADHRLWSMPWNRPATADVRLLAVHPDATGTPRLVTDARQGERWRGDFGPFGDLRDEAGDISLRMRLPGQVFDAETGWHDNYLRTYDPQAGSYLEPDPLGAEPGTEAFGYAAQQPRRYIDPLGLLLFAFDGTNNSPESYTNIFMMKQWYQDKDATDARIADEYYVWGPGSQGSGIGAALDVAASYTAQARIDEQWKNLLGALATYPGTADKPVQIDIIGFSRGSALARHFANMIVDHVKNGRFSARASLFGKEISACVNLRFLGVFDTVPQMFVGVTDAGWNFTIGPGWDQVAHATALHETRQLFPLTTMEAGKYGVGAAQSPVTEIGLIGAHSDLGGGYFYQDGAIQRGDLSNVSLNWMLSQARQAGAQFANLPTKYRYVNDPSVHAETDYRLSGPSIITSPMVGLTPVDRWVNDSMSNRMYAAQQQHPLLGKPLRDQVNAFITPVETIATLTGPVVGTVDMAAYNAWLKKTLGLNMLLAPGPVPPPTPWPPR